MHQLLWSVRKRTRAQIQFWRCWERSTAIGSRIVEQNQIARQALNSGTQKHRQSKGSCCGQFCGIEPTKSHKVSLLQQAVPKRLNQH